MISSDQRNNNFVVDSTLIWNAQWRSSRKSWTNEKRQQVVHGYCAKGILPKGISSYLSSSNRKLILFSPPSPQQKCRKQPFELLILFNHYGWKFWNFSTSKEVELSIPDAKALKEMEKTFWRKTRKRMRGKKVSRFLVILHSCIKKSNKLRLISLIFHSGIRSRVTLRGCFVTKKFESGGIWAHIRM